MLTISAAHLQELPRREPELRPALADVACLACAAPAQIEADLHRVLVLWDAVIPGRRRRAREP